MTSVFEYASPTRGLAMGFLDKLAKTLDLWLSDEEEEDAN
jgi:hypothetical protein